MRRVFALWAPVLGLACLANVAHAASVDSLVIPGMGPATPPSAQPSPRPSAAGPRLGGGFIEFMMTGASGAGTTHAIYNEPPAAPIVHAAPVYAHTSAAYNVPPSQQYASLAPASEGAIEGQPSEEYRRQEVDYSGEERPGTIIIDTPRKYLFWCSRASGRFATASASGGRASNGPA